MARFDSSLASQIKLGSLLRHEEREADQIGMLLAHRAEWPAKGMVSFYQKLAEPNAPTFFDWKYPRQPRG